MKMMLRLRFIPIMVAALVAVICVFIGVGVAISNSTSTDYTRGLSGVVAILLSFPCIVLLMAYVDGAVTLARERMRPGSWTRVCIETAIGSILVLAVTLPLAVAVTRAGWILLVLPLVGVYLLVIAYLQTRASGGVDGGVTPSQ
jgi:hypothetical protein